MSLLEVTGLSTEIDTRQGRIRPVDNVTFSVDAGETLGVVGESGSGKTMTGMSIMRLLPPGGEIVGGSIRLDGQELTGLDEGRMRGLRGNRLAMIFQDPMTSLNPVRTVGSQLREAYRIHRGGSRAAATARATDVLGLVGMPRPRERLDDYPHQLSGGMRQRVMIALGLMCDPGLLIADEPTTALDVSIQAQILTLIDDLKSQLSMGVLLVTHDMGVIAEYADRVAVMYGGRMVEQAGVQELFAAPRHRYTEALLAAMPTLELDRSADLATIPGAPPKLLDLPPQCRFAPRCAFATDDCRSTDPALVPAAPGSEHLYACFHPTEVKAQEVVVADRAGTELRQEPRGSDSLVQLFDVHKKFGLRSRRPFGPKRAVHAVSGVTLTIAAGETFGIVGESGCGKTTIGRMLVGLERPSSGSVTFDGRDLAAQGRNVLRRRRRDLQMMFQDSAAALDPRMTVAALIEEPLVAQGVGTRRERRRTVAELLDAVGLPPDAAQRYPHEFSGGQRQRIAMARALALRPKVIVADEPVSALDVSVQAQILNLMRSLQDRYGQTYVVISHDLSLLKYLADRIGVMYLGRLVELGASEDVYSAPRHPYTAGLIKAIPLPESAKAGTERAVGLGGELPSAIDPPSGCHFRTRCPLATDRCAEEVPTLTAGDGLHAVACHHPLTTEPLSIELTPVR
ncbi:peptide/nickel transport system ATP-binding protein [Kribbella orskensis]|uniref:Peptide/nickel transport system ATP-binding protein n=1 Tax=Kribbella orskensis TaxID=2512216 RepID=A0ABY2BNE2_9ACTN|nr:MULTISPECIES: dipeptide ABC transporter ATP-binding protein [Kribbella]TCN42067.1 peptide/nickel transport system ATP-binding protein [Kribbella sp. VKM Ac-2500]TCO25945.1 peptide/nickel transport system ATP-binding protein [Kribbella orskensis]